MLIPILNTGVKAWKKGRAKSPFLFSKKFQKPLDKFISMLYNKATVEDMLEKQERLDMIGRGGGFFIYKTITKIFFGKIAFYA